MAEYGNVPSSAVRALGIDVGSTHVKAVVARLDGGTVREEALAERPVPPADARALVEAVLDAAARVLRATAPVQAVGIASMAETGALTDPDGAPRRELLRWDRLQSEPDPRTLLPGVDPAVLHARTGAPLTRKLPLLTWAALVREQDPTDARWAFVADLVGAALTGRRATDHTLAGRSGAFRLPDPGVPVGSAWERDLLEAAGVPLAFPPEPLVPGEPLGGALPGVVDGLAAGTPVFLAGHDHAVAAHVTGLDAVVHSLGTTEAVLLRAPRAVDRAEAGAAGISVVRDVSGVHEGVLAGNPAAGALVAAWRRGGLDPVMLPGGEPLALPYPRGRQCPDPDPGARLAIAGDDGLRAIERGLAAHGAWMRAEAARVAGAATGPVRAAGTPVRVNARLAGLMAALSGAPLPVVDLAAPVAVGAAALAAERAGLTDAITAPTRLVEPDDDGFPDLERRFAEALAAVRATPEGAR